MRKYLGNKLVDFVLGILHYVMNKPNPIVQIFYLIIAGGGFVVYVRAAFGKYVPGPYLAEWN